ncbi:MAG TPA: NAD(P)/FAD-dependent oxidoreductase [Anaerolineales bacterium]
MQSNTQKSGSQKYALLIVGSGPAGLSTALHLAQMAPDLIPHMLVLEKAHHPRHKLCGGGLLPDAEIILHHLGLDPTEIPHVNVEWARFDFDGKGFRMRPDPQRSFAFRVIRRHEFDAWLAQKASEKGIKIREGVRVKIVHAGPEGVSLETDSGTLSAEVVVGADGSASIVRRAVIPREDTHTARLLEIITKPQPEHSFHTQTDSYFDFLHVPQGILGYTWDFPALENGKPVRVRGIFDSNVYAHKTDISLREALADEFQHHGYELGDYKLEGHPLRWFEPDSKFSISRILLVGDAAGADALFGEGISIALGYGSIAAYSIKEAFAKNDFSFLGYKEAILSSEMGKALRRRTWWARFFYHLRWRGVQSLVWRHLGPVIEWIMANYLIGWARRQEKRTG